MLKVLLSIFFIIICFLLQGCVFPLLSFGGIVPNLMIIITSSYGFMRGRKGGLLVGFFSGFLIDIFAGNLLGYNALIYMYIGYLNGNLKKLFYPEDIKLPIGLILGSDLLLNIVTYILSFLLRGRFNIGYYFINIIIPEMIYTIVITTLLYPLLLFFETRLENMKKEGESKIVS